MNKIKILFIIITLVTITIISISIYKFFNKEITFYKCEDKPNIDLLEDILKKNKIVRKKDVSAELYMPCGYNYIEDEFDEIYIPKAKYVFGLKGCDNIVSKNSLWEVLEKKFGRNKASTIMPESFVIEYPEEYKKAEKLVNQKILLICKKNLQRKLGLKLIFNKKDLKDALDDDFTVAQVFLTDSRTIKGRKMNMRIYFAIKKTKEKIEFYINTNGKLLYTKEKTSGPITFESHITSFQMDSELYEKEKIPHDFRELEKFMGYKEYHIMWNKLIKKMIDFSKASVDVLDENKFNDKTCFQLFGIDVILDDNEPYILEVNKGPDMIPKCKKDEKLKKTIYDELFNIAGITIRPFQRNNFIKIYQYKY